MHLYLALLLRRDYFAPVRCISILLFCSTGIISPRSNASLSCCFLPQGLFRPTECIPAFLFFPTGIISTSRIHLCLALLLHRDYSDRPDSSLASSFSPQGLFRPVRCISILLFCSSGIISTDRMHPITGRPSLKASLPGHSVNFRFNQSSVTSSLPSPHACPSRIRPLLFSSLQLGTNVHISRVGNCLHLHVVLSRHLNEKLLTELPKLLVRIFSVPDL